MSSFFTFSFFFLTTSTHVTPSSAIEGGGMVGQCPLLLSIHHTHTHTCRHCHVSPRVNLFTCTSVHWSVWKPKLHIFPLASDPCGLTLFLISIFNILCGQNHVATQLFIFLVSSNQYSLVSFNFLFVPSHSYELSGLVSSPNILCSFLFYLGTQVTQGN